MRIGAGLGGADERQVLPNLLRATWLPRRGGPGSGVGWRTTHHRSRCLGDAEAHRQRVPRGQPDRLGGGAHLLRPALAVPGADRDGLAAGPVRRSADDDLEPDRDHHLDRAGIGGADLRGADRLGRLEPERGRLRLRPRRAGGALVGLRLHRRLHARLQRDLRDARGAAVLEAAPAAAGGDPGDGRRDGAAGARPRPHRADRRSGRRRRSGSATPRSTSGASPSGR